MKTKYLQAMGVISWRLRGGVPKALEPAPVKTIRYYRVLAGNNGRSGGHLIVEFSPTGMQAEQQLLTAIIQALGQQSEEIPSLNPQDRTIALGTHPATVNTHSLTDMLKTPALKAPVWRALQDFFKKNLST